MSISSRITLAVALIAILISCVKYIDTQNIFLSAFDFLRRGDEEMRLESMDNKPMESEYDFIIVGAGTAGCTLAARISENPKWRVLLLEAGQHESLIMDVPIVAHFLQLGSMNWKYRTQSSKTACLAMNNNRCNWPRGKVMGGSSVLNYMMYTRGNRRDYDRWSDLGNPGWSYKEILPFFKKLEDSSVPDADVDYVGRGGPVTVSYVSWRSKIADAFVQASQEDGLPYRDYNGKIQVGVSHLHTTTRNSTRTSSNRAYLYPIKGKRPNLHIKKNAHVTKILIDPETKTAYGVSVVIDGHKYKVRARKEVIVSAGAINTPQLLMLSGIGPASHLQEMGIKPIIADLAVGFNLQDHTAPAVTFTTNATSLHFEDFANPLLLTDFMNHHGPYGSPGGCESISFYALDDPKNADGWPDIELFLVGGSMAANPAISRAFGLKSSIYESMFREIEDRNLNAFMIFPMILRPKSRGRILLKSTDPFKYPLIYSNYFDHPYDVDISVRGLLKAISLADKPGFKNINAQLWDRVIPTCKKYGYKTRKYWECYVRHFTFTIYHYSGTCKMGPKTDPTAVVDSHLRVYGVNQLRIIDASIMPEIIAGHPNGPVFMIAERGADFVKRDHGFNQ
ncbi:glucose dehydrogenase [FAD, quinone] [Condylostylus longicornis]|uniref:glucose dehydrogenase [FAD, quinone] n=1 Tax=Condylostylus longicornis TaxID=2530218 RepID=UPI00244E32BA|nr:glucose dehydrogenase [FAD, quinone] [Condylostylus longicornis]